MSIFVFVTLFIIPRAAIAILAQRGRARRSYRKMPPPTRTRAHACVPPPSCQLPSSSPQQEQHNSYQCTRITSLHFRCANPCANPFRPLPPSPPQHFTPLTAQVPAKAPASVTAATSTRFCHISCYTTDCTRALAVKASLLKSGAPGQYTIDAQKCNGTPDCAAIVLYSFATKEDHDAYQKKEKAPPLISRYEAAGLKSATPAGYAKEGPCAGFKVRLGWGGVCAAPCIYSFV
jgi:hypothetical protein